MNNNQTPEKTVPNSAEQEPEELRNALDDDGVFYEVVRRVDEQNPLKEVQPEKSDRSNSKKH